MAVRRLQRCSCVALQGRMRRNADQPDHIKLWKGERSVIRIRTWCCPSGWSRAARATSTIGSTRTRPRCTSRTPRASPPPSSTTSRTSTSTSCSTPCSHALLARVRVRDLSGNHRLDAAHANDVCYSARAGRCARASNSGTLVMRQKCAAGHALIEVCTFLRKSNALGRAHMQTSQLKGHARLHPRANTRTIAVSFNRQHLRADWLQLMLGWTSEI
eukprot:6198607-Pleurochrysis_carterae.AAC.2